MLGLIEDHRKATTSVTGYPFPFIYPCPSKRSGKRKGTKHPPGGTPANIISWLLHQKKHQVRNSQHAVVNRDHFQGPGIICRESTIDVAIISSL